jgi:hypothetical protein
LDVAGRIWLVLRTLLDVVWDGRQRRGHEDGHRGNRLPVMDAVDAVDEGIPENDDADAIPVASYGAAWSYFD